VAYTVFIQKQDKVYFVNLALKFTYQTPNQTAPNWITLAWTMHSQTKACIARTSSVNKSEKRA
jgi:hypothetical protein